MIAYSEREREFTFAKKTMLTLVWIPGHVGLKYNEQADSLAKVATRNKTVDVDIKYELEDIVMASYSNLLPVGILRVMFQLVFVCTYIMLCLCRSTVPRR